MTEVIFSPHKCFNMTFIVIEDLQEIPMMLACEFTVIVPKTFHHAPRNMMFLLLLQKILKNIPIKIIKHQESNYPLL